MPFVKGRIHSIDSLLTDDEKNYELLKVLCEVADDTEESVMNGFISALRSSGQDHVANVFHRTSDKVRMSDEHRETLLAKLDKLQKFTDTENGLLVALVSHGVVSIGDTERIQSVKNQNGMARKLVEILLRKSDEAFNQFIDSLNETGQAHVAYILTGEGDRRPLKEEHRRRLLSGAREDLVNMMDSKQSGLITALMSKDVFSVYDQQRVISVQPDTVCDRNELILNLIARKSQTDFFNFISALNDTGQTHVAAALLGADVIAKVMTAYESHSHMPDADAELLEYMRITFENNGDVVTRLNDYLSQSGVTVSRVREGCIEVTFACKTVQSLHAFKALHHSGKLENMVNEAFCPQFAKKGLKSLKVVISNEEFEQCAETFGRWVPMTSEHREALLSSENWLVDKMTVIER